MNEKKKEIFVGTLTQPYQHDRYVLFLRELLPKLQLIAPNQEQKPWNTFSVAVDHYRHIGNYVGEDQQKVALFTVCLYNDRRVENARTMQRSFVKTLLEASDCAGALVAFHTKEEPEKWRLSLVRLDYEFSKGKISEKLTPAKRYSYLVGKGEPCHTAQERLYPIFLNDDYAPTLDELENAFSVEAVTKDFFDQYREKYLVLKEYLESNPQFISEAESRGFDSEQFAKKLMGQIVFLYFIQKKGWLGVNAFPAKMSEREYKASYWRTGSKPKELMPLVYKQKADGIYVRDNDALMALSEEDKTLLSTFVKGDKWGSGPKDFMRRIFEGCMNAGKNYFDDYLEPLFYTGLNRNRGENAFFPPLHRRIPFLNGGLFEELKGYQWESNDFSIPNEIFSNVHLKGRDADGILDVFDRFNFTMAEDEPMEREVAIDPEMLGKVFENLLDVKDRKSKGAFYTPREIVHYMCQESLINYLATRTGISDDDIRKFILYGEYFRDEDTRRTIFVKGEGAEKGHYEFDYEKTLELPTSILSYKDHVNRLRELDELLANVKVVDPAVGSGAFPLGMLTEIVKARETLTSYMTIEMSRSQRLSFRSQRNTYRLKRDTIKNCIFACDIEASATDITKLRLWLSLVIDNQIMDQEDDMLGYSTKPRELPNLDCNIVCGNSLMDSFKGVPLLSEVGALENLSTDRQTTEFDAEVASLIDELIELQSKLYDEKDHIAKDALKGQIEDIYNKIVLEQFSSSPELIDDYYQAVQQPSKPFVLWPLYFPKVFQENGGFDIVIGNPPYIQLQKTIDEENRLKLGDIYVGCNFKTFTKTGDIYCLFYEKGYGLLRKDGVLTFITSNKWMRAGYGEKLRSFLANNTNPICLIDFASQKIFESATVDVNVLLFTKSKNQGLTQACTIKGDCINNLSIFVQQHSYSGISYTSSDSWIILTRIEQTIKQKIKERGTPLSEWGVRINYGIKTGYNEAFIINSAKKEQLISEDPRSAEIIRPILRGRDIRRYGYNWANLWLISTFPSRQYNIDDFPAIKKYLLSFGMERLEQTGRKYTIDGHEIKARKKTNNKWFETQDSIGYWDDFSKQRIAFAETMRVHKAEGADRFPRFTYIDTEFFHDKTCFIITGDNLLYILAVLNSSVMNYYIHKNIAVLDSGGFLMQKIYIEMMPIPKATPEIHQRISSLTTQIVETRKEHLDSALLEDEIDEIIFKLYGFSSDEVEYIKRQIQEQINLHS